MFEAMNRRFTGKLVLDSAEAESRTFKKEMFNVQTIFQSPPISKLF